MKAFGIDPGFASTGWAALSKKGEKFKVEDSGYIASVPVKKILRHGIRTTDDDSRRLIEISDQLLFLLGKHKPDVVGIEAFSLQPGKGSAWKAALGYAAATALTRVKKSTLFTFTPSDIKAFVGDKSASKLKVRETITEAYLPDYDWSKVPKTKQEHVGDALALALMAAEQLEEYRKTLGFKE